MKKPWIWVVVLAVLVVVVVAVAKSGAGKPKASSGVTLVAGQEPTAADTNAAKAAEMARKKSEEKISAKLEDYGTRRAEERAAEREAGEE